MLQNTCARSISDIIRLEYGRISTTKRQTAAATVTTEKAKRKKRIQWS